MAAEGTTNGVVLHRREIHDAFYRSPLTGDFAYFHLFEQYAHSHYGMHHSRQPARYSQDYGYDRLRMLDDLGDDVHPVKHMNFTEKQILRPFLMMQNASRDTEFEYATPQQVAALRAGTLIHDIGECEHPNIAEAVGATVGDVFYETKTSEHEDTEKLVRDFLYAELYATYPDEIIDMAEDVVAGSDDEFIKDAFNTVERIGYFTTGLRAGRLALREVMRAPEATPDHRVIQLARLGMRVTDVHRDVLTERGARFPLAATVVIENATIDKEIHERLAFISELPKTV